MIYLHPGYVWSNDGDRHYICGHTLRRLYGLKVTECVIVSMDSVDPRERAERPHPGDIHLFPRRDGKYEKPAHRQENE